MNINIKNIISTVGDFYTKSFPTLKKFGLHHAFLTALCIYLGSWVGLADFMASGVPIFYLGKEFKELENRRWVKFETMDFVSPVITSVVYFWAIPAYTFLSGLI